MFLKPPLIMAWARMVDVVVPSPQASFVLLAASLTIWTPMFSKGSASSMSLAMVTPSSMTEGAPQFLSSATQWPLGPRVTLTASARASMPFFRACLTSSPKIICFAIFLPPYFPGLFGLLRQNIALAENHHFFIIDFDFRAPVLGVNDLVANLEVHGNPFAFICHFARPYRHDFSLLGFFLGCIRQVYPGLGFLFLLHGFNQDAVCQGLQFSCHTLPPFLN